MPNDREQTACCGLYCRDCIPSNRSLFDTAERLRQELEKCRFGAYAEYKSKNDQTFDHFATFQEVLEAILTLRCPRPCSQSGGRSDCPIRACARERSLEGCWQCADFETCSLLEPLAVCHGDTVRHNLRTIRRLGVENWAHQRGEHYVWSKKSNPPDQTGIGP